jgi:hypothetical protein
VATLPQRLCAEITTKSAGEMEKYFHMPKVVEAARSGLHFYT